MELNLPKATSSPKTTLRLSEAIHTDIASLIAVNIFIRRDGGGDDVVEGGEEGDEIEGEGDKEENLRERKEGTIGEDDREERGEGQNPLG